MLECKVSINNMQQEEIPHTALSFTVYIFAEFPQSKDTCWEVIFKWRKEASTVLPLTPSGTINIRTALFPECHYSEMKWDVWGMKCESRFITIWSQPKGCKEKTLDCLKAINFINTDELVLNRLPRAPLSIKRMCLLDKISSSLFHACVELLHFFVGNLLN